MIVPFIDRRRELRVLDEEWNKPGFRMIVVYGRRRIGKTRLLVEWLRQRRGVYYEAAELSYQQLAAEFSRVVGKQLGVYVSPSDVVKALEDLGQRADRIAIVLDEFQYLVNADGSLPSRLARSIDTVLQRTNLVLVLSGSAVSFFEKELLGYRAPLHGRRTSQLRLRPLRMIEAWEFWPRLGSIDALRAYSVVGGTPAYLALTYGVESLEELLKRVLDPASPLLEEALFLLRQELREPRSYAALIKAVVDGATRPSEAAYRAGIDPRSVHRYIEVLEELDIARRRTPLGFRRGARIFITDPYFRFYFGFITWAKNLVEQGLVDEVVEEAKHVIDAYASKTFEEWVEQHLGELYSLGVLPTRPVEYGSWWHRGEEIDLVVRDPGTSTSFIEAKWSDLSMYDTKNLIRELEKKAKKTGLMGPENYYIIVARRLKNIEDEAIRLDEHRIAINYFVLAKKLRRILGDNE
ncbi:ATP-binding protein [Pyrofollis japonicus]|uniref:ATP-binding protein n=1 Tax=Pyrofollis japonicus TaxID=3060460 RepID=UPI00295AE4AF|nr:ATP-binding protein [Pyrofollis japonicus]BEP18706.1 ATP-binding protein [Pyrofollis japonicus]